MGGGHGVGGRNQRTMNTRLLHDLPTQIDSVKTEMTLAEQEAVYIVRARERFRG